VGRSRGFVKNKIYRFREDGKCFLYANQITERGKRTPTHILLWWPTKAIRTEVLPQFLELYAQLKGYKPHCMYSDRDVRISFSPVNESNLVMATGYGNFKLEPHNKGRQIIIQPFFNLAEFLSPLISSTAIVGGFSPSELTEKLQEVLSRNQKLKPYKS